jgi:hypothetical protein
MAFISDLVHFTCRTNAVYADLLFPPTKDPITSNSKFTFEFGISRALMAGDRLMIAKELTSRQLQNPPRAVID